MVTKAVIEEIVSENKVRVRMPIFNKIADAPNATPFEELSEATICTLPGCKDNCKVGDVVYVAFEDNDAGRPVVVGYLQREYDTGTLPDITAGELVVEGQAVLPHNTTIGSVTPDNLQQLADLAQNIQANLNQLKANIQDLYENGVGGDSGLWKQGYVDHSITTQEMNCSAGAFGFAWNYCVVKSSNYEATFELCDIDKTPISDEVFNSIEIGDLVSCKARYSWSLCGTVKSKDKDDETTTIVVQLNSPIPSRPTTHGPSTWYPEDFSGDNIDIENAYFWFVEKPTLGFIDIPIGEGSISIGRNNKANELGSFSVGGDNISDGRYSFTVGRYNKAAYAAFAEGYTNESTGLYSHTEGAYNFSGGNSAHTEGRENSTRHHYSHTEGRGNETGANYQHVQGKYNLKVDTFTDNGITYTMLDVIGCGNSSTKKNAFVVDDHGNLYLRGKIYCIQGNKTIQTLEGDRKLLTIGE